MDRYETEMHYLHDFYQLCVTSTDFFTFLEEARAEEMGTERSKILEEFIYDLVLRSGRRIEMKYCRW